jgi:hypothetical protein
MWNVAYKYCNRLYANLFRNSCFMKNIRSFMKNVPMYSLYMSCFVFTHRNIR